MGRQKRALMLETLMGLLDMKEEPDLADPRLTP